MEASAEVSAPVASRRRGEALRRAIFDAVIEQLGSVGYAKLSTNRVAAAAGTGKAALYRRWSNKEELVRDALLDLLPEPPRVDLSASLRDGLLAQLTYLNSTLFDSKGAAFQAFAAAAADQPSELRAFLHETVSVPCQERIAELLRLHTAVPDKDRPLIAAAGPAMLMYHCMSGSLKSTDTQIEAVVDGLLLPLCRER
ncbi:DNA-binding transcriptional regulator, AcrR family [Sinosporangium album]|uniref:DNA-binding transcriptional regulator, AcrR family n=1 Tax=Sinosporangium album TaxID=504805 RepID=A0A1G7YE91_9ACTN|nr:TetR family transcriptional regulator [Sinosporangium album]SDG94677.1 DNA-binding transcriptional regulator, AcrR family [Sinosporangium album]